MDISVRLLNALLMIAMPLALGAFLVRRWRQGWRTFLIGMATFLASQVIHIPVNAALTPPLASRLGVAGASEGLPLAGLALMLGLSGGLFEEGARYLVYRTWLLKERFWRGALLFGAGHGGLESLLVGLLALFAFFQAVAYREADLGSVLPPDRVGLAVSQLHAYWSAPPAMAILGALERAMALLIQMGLAVFVLQAFVRRQVRGLWFAIGWHALVDSSAVYAVGASGAYAAEGVVALLSVATFGITLALPGKNLQAQPTKSAPGPVTPLGKAQPSTGFEAVSNETLDNSRYE